MRVIFAGTPEFARTALQAVHQAGHEIVLVLTQPDRPAGRGMKLQASPVKQYAQTHAMPLAQPRSLRLEGKFPDEARAAADAIAAARADVMVVAAYGLLLPQWVLDAPRLGCLNIHASLLPRWRGAAPIHRAVEAGDPHSGVTIMQMDAGLDTGDMLLVESLPLAPAETTGSLHDRLGVLGAAMIVRALHDAEAGTLHRTPQPAEGVTYAHKIDKAEAAVRWSDGAPQIARKLRAFDPFPGAAAALQGESVKLWAGEALPATGEAHAPGTVVAVDDHGIDVACGEGVLRLTQLQRPGGRRMAAADFLRGFAVQPGMRFDSAAG